MTRLRITQYLKAGNYSWPVSVEGMTKDQMEGLVPGQEIVAR